MKHADNSYGRGYFPLPARLSGLGRFSDALKPTRVRHTVFPDEGIHMLTIQAGPGFSIMSRDLESLLRLGLMRMQSNEPGEISFYFQDKPLQNNPSGIKRSLLK